MVAHSTTPDHTILICTTCRGVDAAAAMRAVLACELDADFAFRAVDCLAGCDHPVAVGLQARGKASYLFGPIENDGEVAAIGDFARDYRASRDGWTSSTQRPAALADKTLARLPAMREREAS